MAEHKLVRDQEKGQLAPPSDGRNRLGLNRGDLVAFVGPSEGALIAAQLVLATSPSDSIGETLRED